MKLNKSDRSFLDACQNPERRTALIGNLVTQRKWYYVISGLFFVLCMADAFVRMAGVKSAPPSPLMLVELLFVVSLALHADSKIKALLAVK